MYYEINVALNGKHFFATHKRSITDSATLIKVLNTFRDKFLASEGYAIMYSVHPEESYGIALDPILGVKDQVQEFLKSVED
jgi:hypothetical protein